MFRNFRFNITVLNILQHLNCLSRICCAVAISFAAAANATPQAASSYAVVGIEVDRTADTAASARRQAIIEAHIRALELLLTRLVPADQRASLPAIDYVDIVPMVQSFGVDKERRSGVRYIGTLSFQFRRQEVRQFMRKVGVNFAETSSKPMLLLPVLDFGGAKLLWDVPNVWFEAWNSIPLDNRLVPIVLPIGELADIRDISAEQAVVGSKEQIDAIRMRYGATTAIVAEATPDLVTVPGGRNFNVSLHSFGGVWEGDLGTYTFRVQDGQGEAEALTRIALEISLLIEERWKLDNILELDNSANLIVEISLDELREWVEIRRRLGAIAFVKNFELVSLSRTQVAIRLAYFGSPKQLKTALAQLDLVLSRGPVNWMLRDSRRPVGEVSSLAHRQSKTLLSNPRDADIAIEPKPGSLRR